MKVRTLLIILLCAASNSFAASTDWKTNSYGQVRLLSSHQSAPTQGEIFLGLHFKTIPGWHVYWKNSGDAGFAPQFTWKGSQGLDKTEVFWPMPHLYKLPGGLKAIGYEGEVVYPVRAQVHSVAGHLHLVADVNYLTCGTSELCVPFHYTFTLDLPAGVASLDPEASALIEQYRAQVPAIDPTVDQIPVAGSSSGVVSVWWVMLLGFIGGLILNVMPCVLPVLSIKLLWFFQQGEKHHPLVIRGGALAGAAGIIASFIGLALVAIGARHLGHAVGWGIQFQEPVFVAFLGLVIFLFALNLWGVFEIGMPRFLGQFATSASGEENWISHFVSGLFVTLLATPCSAPFLGTAMGFALAQPARVILLTFIAAGTGMAFPYLALAAAPSSVRWLPKPGGWMIQIRYFMGFLLILTLGWLEFVLSRQIAVEGLVRFNILLAGVGLLAWIKEMMLIKHHGESKMSTRSLGLLIVVLFALALGVVHRHRLVETSGVKSTTVSAPDEIHWVPFDQTVLPALVVRGDPVFVDITADWCFTCKYNESFVLRNPQVLQAIQKRGIVMMRADWTNRNEEIGSYLKQFGRVGIPFYVFYEKGKKPVLLSELLTVNQVLSALNSGQ